jgi:hypothetical protein
VEWLECNRAKVKLTFEFPSEVGETFRRVVPDSERSVLVTKLMADESRRRTADAVAACNVATG